VSRADTYASAVLSVDGTTTLLLLLLLLLLLVPLPLPAPPPQCRLANWTDVLTQSMSPHALASEHRCAFLSLLVLVLCPPDIL
jgi:hypothetical protein